MIRILKLLVLLAMVPLIFAGSATQTDWSGGYGIPGPVWDWGNEFYLDTNIESYTVPGSVSLHNVLPYPIEHMVAGSIDGAYCVYATDIDGDGDVDVLFSAVLSDAVIWCRNDDGLGLSWTKFTIRSNFGAAADVYATDIDGDGDTDVVGVAFDSNEITWWENDDGSGTSWTEHVLDYFGGALSVFAIDVDGDGDTDIIGAAQVVDDITWWENEDGTGTSWTRHTIDSNFDGASSVHASDIDGDGDIDVMGTACHLDEVTWWENEDGTGMSWTKHTIDRNFDFGYDIFSIDIDGDGDVDVLAASKVVDGIAWWENSDTSPGMYWTRHPVDSLVLWCNSVHAADVDGDGDIDVLGQETQDDNIMWWENDDGTGTSWTEHMISSDFNGASSVYACDINGDGITDVFGAAYVGNIIAWWEVIGYSEGLLESSILDLQELPEWQYLEWTGIEPPGTSIVFQVRASDDSENMGSWSDTLFTPGSIAEVIEDTDSLFQYRAILITSDPDTTPVLQDVTVSWELYTGIEGGVIADEYILHGAVRNPSPGDAELAFSIPVDSRVDLMVYDLSGRLVRSVSDNFRAGDHQVNAVNLTSGVYFVLMNSDEFTATTRFVVLE